MNMYQIETLKLLNHIMTLAHLGECEIPLTFPLMLHLDTFFLPLLCAAIIEGIGVPYLELRPWDRRPLPFHFASILLLHTDF